MSRVLGLVPRVKFRNNLQLYRQKPCPYPRTKFKLDFQISFVRLILYFEIELLHRRDEVSAAFVWLQSGMTQ